MLFNKELLNAELQINDDNSAIDQADCQVLALFLATLVSDSRDLIRHSEAAHRCGDTLAHLLKK